MDESEQVLFSIVTVELHKDHDKGIKIVLIGQDTSWNQRQMKEIFFIY